MFEPLTISNRVCGVRKTSLRTMRAAGTSGCPRLAPSNRAGPPSSTNTGNGSSGCSYAYAANELSASYSATAASHEMTFGPNSRRHISMADAMCSAHETATAIGAKSALRRQSSMSASRLRRRIASRRHDAVAHHLGANLRETRAAAASSAQGAPACRRACRVVRAAAPRRGRCARRVCVRARQDHLEDDGDQEGRHRPPRTHQTTPPMMPAASTMAARRSQILSGAAGADAHALSAMVSTSR